MTTYYKAVRPNGASFFNERFMWATEPGCVTVHPDFVGDNDNAINYLSVSTVPTDCTGFSWPCRLLEVEAVGDVFTPNAIELPNKRAGAAFRTVRELPSHEVFGPNGVAVVAIIDRARTLTRDELERLAAARDAARAAARVAAWAAAIAALVRDLITVEQYELLAGPWNSVVGGAE